MQNPQSKVLKCEELDLEEPQAEDWRFTGGSLEVLSNLKKKKFLELEPRVLSNLERLRAGTRSSLDK